MEKNIYQEHGFQDRDRYLSALAASYCVPLSVVRDMADKLGRDEEFGRLPIRLRGMGSFPCLACMDD